MSDSAMPEPFDRQLAAMIDLPDVVKTRPAMIRTVSLFGVGGSTLHVIQTLRQGDATIVFLEVVDATGTKRIVIPAEVADVIARQRDACSTLLRKKLSRQQAADRKARGEAPAFLRRAK